MLHEDRDQEHGRHERRHDEDAQEHAGREPRVLQQAEIHHGSLRGELARDESHERRDGDEREDADEGVIEPVAPLSFLDDELRRCQARGQERDSGPVDVRPLGGGARAILREDLRILADEGPGHHQPEETDGQRDEEDPRPVEVIDDVAAEHRAECGADHHDHARERHGHPLLGLRERLTEDGLLGRLHGAPSEPLEDAERDELRKRARESAQAASEQEEAEAQHVDALLPEAATEERDQRHEEDRRDRVTRREPGDLLKGRAYGPLNLGKRHVDDGGVEHAHDRSAADRSSDEPFVDRRRGHRAHGRSESRSNYRVTLSLEQVC